MHAYSCDDRVPSGVGKARPHRSRYIELNPVRAWLIAQPGGYAWSSYRANAAARVDPLLTPPAEYLALGSDPAARASAYRALFDDALPCHLVDEIRSYLQQQKVLGTDRLRSWIEGRTGRFAAVRPLGRAPRHVQLFLAPFSLAAFSVLQSAATSGFSTLSPWPIPLFHQVEEKECPQNSIPLPCRQVSSCRCRSRSGRYRWPYRQCGRSKSYRPSVPGWRQSPFPYCPGELK